MDKKCNMSSFDSLRRELDLKCSIPYNNIHNNIISVRIIANAGCRVQESDTRLDRSRVD